MAGKARAPQPQERRSTEWAYTRLRERILAGELEAGKPVSQASLAEEFGVSRTPLREAMRLLQNEGLLEGEPNQRLRVAGVSLVELEQLYSMRIANECLALKVGVPLMAASEIEALESALESMESGAMASDFDLVQAAHRDFHTLLVSRGGERFVQMAGTLWDHTARYRSAYVESAPSSAAVLMDAQVDHARILSAVRDGDGEAASAALAAHYLRTAQTLLMASDSQHQPQMLLAAAESAGASL